MLRFASRPSILAGSAVLLAVTAAVAGNGVGGVFNLGQTNTVDATTQLSGAPRAPQLHVINNSRMNGAAGVRATAGRAGVNYGVHATTGSATGYAGYFQNTSRTTNAALGRGIRSLAAGALPTLFNPGDGAAGGEFAGPNGMIGVASHPDGAGVIGRSASADGFAGFFQNSSTTTDPTKGRGVRALAAGASPTLFSPTDGAAGGEFAGPNGMIGVASHLAGAGVVGRSGQGTFGVFGSTTNKDGYGGFFQNTNTTGNCTDGAGLRVLGAGATGSEIPGNICAGGGEFIGQNNGVVAVGGIGVVAIARETGGLSLQAHGKASMLGDVTVSGVLRANGGLIKPAGTFKIDHPQDPANKYLSHSFVESPDMKNVYDGNVVTDAEGLAVVELPNYFEALNRDPRYQLTVIGSFADAQISREISGNSFSIRTEEPNVKVSWQVTGIRKDAYAAAHPIVVEEDKLLAERGRYLHPEEHGQPADLAIHHAQGKLGQQAKLAAPVR